jgi:hypothetical protein
MDGKKFEGYVTSFRPRPVCFDSGLTQSQLKGFVHHRNRTPDRGGYED